MELNEKKSYATAMTMNQPQWQPNHRNPRMLVSQKDYLEDHPT